MVASEALTLKFLLSNQGLDTSDLKLVRHRAGKFDVYSTYRHDREAFEVYNAEQARQVYKGARYIAVLAAYHGTLAIFLGVYKVNGLRQRPLRKHLRICEKYGWRHAKYSYSLTRMKEFDELSERVIVDWGPSTRSWVQRKDKPVVEIRAAGSIGEFSGYDDILLNFHELEDLVNSPVANRAWHAALSSVNGIYLVVDVSTGKQYVGSAYGRGGMLARWRAYVRTGGHAGNDALAQLIKKHPRRVGNLEFSVLQIMPATATADDVITTEGQWKRKLLTREFGLNRN
jgi:hypothetical protein